MKSLRVLALTLGVLITSLFQSCLDDEHSLNKYWLGIATVESLADDSHFFRLDDGSTLKPVSGYYLGHNFEAGQRVWLNFTILNYSEDDFTYYAKINGIDPVLVKEIAEDKGEMNDGFYGIDPVSVKDMWIGGGYLNVKFAFNYGGTKTHMVSLIPAGDDENPYSFEFRHNAYADPLLTSVWGIVCFDLASLPDTEGETVMLTVHVKTFYGNRKVELEYNSDIKESTEIQSAVDLDLNYFEKVN